MRLIERLLGERTQCKDWERFEVRRLLGSQERTLILRGLGVPDGRGTRHARMIVTLEENIEWKIEGGHLPTEEFHLTQRERGVLDGLAKGWTNKEIANSLEISTHTVREHIHHIMEKTKSSTRTGILAKVFRMFSDRAFPVSRPDNSRSCGPPGANISLGSSQGARILG